MQDGIAGRERRKRGAKRPRLFRGWSDLSPRRFQDARCKTNALRSTRSTSEKSIGTQSTRRTAQSSQSKTNALSPAASVSDLRVLCDPRLFQVERLVPKALS